MSKLVSKLVLLLIASMAPTLAAQRLPAVTKLLAINNALTKQPCRLRSASAVILYLEGVDVLQDFAGLTRLCSELGYLVARKDFHSRYFAAELTVTSMNVSSAAIIKYLGLLEPITTTSTSNTVT